MFAFSLPIPGSDAAKDLAAFDPSQTSTTRMAPIGAHAWHNHSTYGMQLYRQVKASAADVAAYMVCAWSVTTDAESVSVAAAAANKTVNSCAGVPQNAIANGSYGWALVRGVGKGTGQADISAGALVRLDTTAGKVDDTALSATGLDLEYLGRAIEAFDVSEEVTGKVDWFIG